MANRSYLFVSSQLPTDRWDAGQRTQLRGISEHAYAVPLLYRLLVSEDSRLVDSAIWQDPAPLAIAGRAQAGMERALQFLEQIQNPHIEPLRREAEMFLRSHIQPGDWLILEAAEVLAMDDDSQPEQQVRTLLARMPQLDAECTQTIADLRPQPPNIWQRIFKPSEESLQEPLLQLGLGDWAEHLYFSWDSSPSDESEKDET